MKKKVLIVIYIILIIITAILLYVFINNSILVKKYKNGQYLEKQANRLAYLSFTQNYVANYNYGNILYQNGKYEEAIKEYKKALTRLVPREKECSIRINYALAICKTVQVDEKEEESIKEAINKYEFAIDILTEKNCANKDNNNGHSPNAERLKKDIEKEIDRLKKLQKDKKATNKEDEKKEDNETIKETETIEEKMKDIKEEATKDQRSTEKLYKNYSKKYKKNDKNW